MLSHASTPKSSLRQYNAPTICARVTTKHASVNYAGLNNRNLLHQSARAPIWVGRLSPLGQLTPSWTCRSASINPVPSDLRLEVKPEDGTSNVEYDEENKVVRIPLSALGPEGQRRTKLVLFTCNKCGGRTARLVNPVAWEQGVVFGQCSKCEVWHVLSAKNKKIFEEVRYKEDPEYADLPQGVQSADAEMGVVLQDEQVDGQDGKQEAR